MEPSWRRAARFVGIEPDIDQAETMSRYAAWLEDEALPAGGLGPRELQRIPSRHLADSIVFASAFPPKADSVADLGSGVGLPGIPLAILLPDVSFTLIDRSGRRVDLARRAIRVLGLENVQALQGDFSSLDMTFDVVVSRALAPPDALFEPAQRLLDDGGVMVVGGSTTAPPHHPGWETREIPRDVLDHRSWLLIMRRP